MDKCYIISRFRAENEIYQDFNKEVARFFCKEVLHQGFEPVAPHIYYTQFLNDKDPADRQLGLEMGLEALRNCQRFLLVVIDGVISEGMKNELVEVSRLGIPGNLVSYTHFDIFKIMRDSR